MYTLHACFRARDAHALIAFLEAIGFERALVVDGPDQTVEHAELTWRGAGGVMLGSIRGDGSVLDETAGHAAAYLVTEHDHDVDGWFTRAVAAGGRPEQEPADQDFGGRSASVLDPEGNFWSCGSYAGERPH
ncbi:VOC family protein [Ruania alkalisoli]|uniref:VOC family protein n=1 Tax=Ruania alkalisoli TaxID=2779775 RepID=A0A7M1SNW3_9MICO|nr:VOC family protein [Ruania alkalisoli]QOR69266.1 VOC family protein [Ruania alkalisoli]